jgi:hypothetical protein
VEYISYLKKKDPTEDSGIESYVREQLKEQSMEWIPTRTSYFLELHRMAKKIPSSSSSSSSASSVQVQDQKGASKDEKPQLSSQPSMSS